MARPGFYNDNLGRWYPFLPPAHEDELSANLPLSAVADALAVFSARSGYKRGSAQSTVYLSRVFRSGPIIHFVFRVDPGPASWPPHHALLDQTSVVFCRHIADPIYAMNYQSSHIWGDEDLSATIPSSTSYSSEVGAGHPLWYMHLVSGDMEELARVMPDSTTWTGRLELLPTLVHVQHRLLSTLRVGNVPRPRATAPQGCRPPCSATPVPVLWEEPAIQGDELLWSGGIQSLVSIDPASQTVQISADVSAGSCRPCGEVPIHDDEQPPIGSSLLTGGPACDELIRSINGVGGPHIQIDTGPGISVTRVPERHRLILEVHGRNLLICDPLAQTVPDPRPDPPYSHDPCQCGPQT